MISGMSDAAASFGAPSADQFADPFARTEASTVTLKKLAL